jgi:Zn-finger nucleic acid-binding protein
MAKNTKMKCPRCKLPLLKTDYEGVETDMCSTCWGFWLDRGELEDVLDKRDMSFSESERRTILDLKSASDPGPTAPAPCPKCGQVMKRFHYDEAVHLVIDRCEDHGIWLDTGEIKKVQALAERSEAVHKLLLRKLGFYSTA